jgi:hypothetical protein
MDTGEATQLLTWLDEERRRDKALLVDLRKSIEQHENLLSHISERMERLEEALAQTDAEVARMSRFEHALEKFKRDILSELQRSEERFRKEVNSAEGLLRTERQERAKALAELGKRVEQSLQIEEKLQTERTEIRRVNKAVSALKLQIDEAVQEDKEQHEKLRFLESWAKQGGQQMADLQALGERLRAEQAQLVEQMRTIDDRRMKQITKWGKELSSWRKEAGQRRELGAVMDKQYRSGERMFAALDRLKTQLEQYPEALEHLQHTGEERQRQQLEEWRKENEMLWLQDDERWRGLSEGNAKRDAHVARLWESQIAYQRQQVGQLAKWIRLLEKQLVRYKKSGM